MKKKVIYLLVSLILNAMFCLIAYGSLTPDEVANIAVRNVPPALVETDELYKREGSGIGYYDLYNPEGLIDHEQLSYLQFNVPNDTSNYLLLVWKYWTDIYCRLMISTNGNDYVVYQDFPRYGWQVGARVFRSIYIRQEYVTGSQIPEILVTDSPRDMTAMVVFQWRNGKLVDLAPEESYGNSMISYPLFSTSMGMEVVLNDLDEDGKAEVIVYPWGERYPVNPPNMDDWDWVFDGPLRIYKYDGSFYTLWQEYPFSLDDPYPISVPALGAFHPSTIPYSELSNGGNGKMRIFVCNPPKGFTVDDIDTTKFVYKGNSLNFKKKWKNNKYPDIALANFEWQGSPVRQIKRQNQGEWQLNPDDPFIPSPDGEMEYHFVGPYLELEISKSLFFPDIQNKASSFFEQNPEKQTFFTSVKITGKMKNGKLLSVSALICIKKTGNVAEKEKSQNTDSSKTTNPKQT
ncbi:MAG: hypothetical protein GYA35_06490 [Thermoanaerobaculaceae bacterium]|nr:hypothetical protein [Thermoanaerobaculaceae bacterium]